MALVTLQEKLHFPEQFLSSSFVLQEMGGIPNYDITLSMARGKGTEESGDFGILRALIVVSTNEKDGTPDLAGVVDGLIARPVVGIGQGSIRNTHGGWPTALSFRIKKQLSLPPGPGHTLYGDQIGSIAHW